MLLHRSDLNTSEKIRQFFSHFFGNILQKIVFLIDFCSEFDTILSEFRR